MSEVVYTLGHITHIGGKPGTPGTPIRSLRFTSPHEAEFSIRKLPDGNYGVTNVLSPWGHPIITGTTWEGAAYRMGVGLPEFLGAAREIVRALEPKEPASPQAAPDEPPQPPVPPECGATIIDAPEA